MSLMNVTADSLSQQVGQEVPDIYVVIAKHSVMGMESDGIQRVLGCPLEDIRDVENTELYKQVRLIVGALYASQTVDQALSWDAIEAQALQNLMKRVEHTSDTDQLLRIAAVANKAQRRQSTQDRALEPGQAGRSVITLSQRLVTRITRGVEETTEERQLSIRDGSMKNPTFDEVDSMLNVSNRPILPEAIEIRTATPDLSFDDLDSDMRKRGT